MQSATEGPTLASFFSRVFGNGNWADIISCIFTIIALAFTLYFWLLDHLSEDESKFIEGKTGTLDALDTSLKTIVKHKEPPCAEDETEAQAAEGRENAKAEDVKEVLEAISEVNKRLEVILNYRFWARSRQKEEYARISKFYRDSRFLISTMRRYRESVAGEDAVAVPSSGPVIPESRDLKNDGRSLLSIETFQNSDLWDVCTDYEKGLNYIIEFIENWG